MNNIEIKPLVSVVFNNAEIKLGASESEVKAALGEPYSVWENSLYYFENELRFDFDDGTVEFIEFLGGIDGGFSRQSTALPLFRPTPTSCMIYSANGTRQDRRQRKPLFIRFFGYLGRCLP